MESKETRVEVLEVQFNNMQNRMSKVEQGLLDLGETVNQRFDKFETILKENTTERRSDICRLENRMVDNEKAMIEIKQQYKPISKSYESIVSKLVEMVIMGLVIASAYFWGFKQ